MGKNNFYLIVSPPRVGSTLLGASLAMSNDIDRYVHETSFVLKYDSLDLEDYRKQVSEIAMSSNSPILKEMSHWLGINDSYKFMFSEAIKPIVFLIKEPIIAIESKIRRSLMTSNLRDKTSLQDLLKGYVAKNEGFADWRDLENQHFDLSQVKIATPLGEAIVAAQGKCSQFHKSLLDYFARSKSYSDWEDLIKTSFTERDYNVFSELLEDESIFSTYDLGWEAIDEQIAYCENKSLDYVIVDGTEHRIVPNKITEALAIKLGIEYQDSMVRWGNNLPIEDNSQDEPYQKIWYSTLANSKGVLKPTEIPIAIGKFPQRIREYIIQNAYPVYLKHFFSKNNIGVGKINEDDINEETPVPFNKEYSKLFNKLGMKPIIKARAELEENLFDADEDSEKYTNASIKFINPIYTQLRFPGNTKLENYAKEVYPEIIDLIRKFNTHE